MDDDARLFDVFLDVQRGLPRQGPGCDEGTLKALSLCSGLPDRPAVLDIGCGPGMQTVTLARATHGRIAAVDLHREYLDDLKGLADAAGVAARIQALAADMNALPFRPRSFDLIWAEGSAYVMDFAKAMAAWKQLLKPGGWIAVTELVWLRPDPPAEAAAFFANEYPAMRDVEAVAASIRACGYQPLAHFTLPDAAWWEHYYTPLESKLPSLSEKYAGDEAATSVVETTRREIEIRRLFRDWYGYEFFIGRA